LTPLQPLYLYYRLVIAPPAIRQANFELPALLVDLSFHNLGGRPAIISDMAIQTLKHATELGVKLHVQQVFERFVEFKTKGLIQDVTPHALFMPLVVRSGDAVTERFLFTPYDDGTKVPYRDLLETTRKGKEKGVKSALGF